MFHIEAFHLHRMQLYRLSWRNSQSGRQAAHLRFYCLTRAALLQSKIDKSFPAFVCTTQSYRIVLVQAILKGLLIVLHTALPHLLLNLVRCVHQGTFCFNLLKTFKLTRLSLTAKNHFMVLCFRIVLKKPWGTFPVNILLFVPVAPIFDWKAWYQSLKHNFPFHIAFFYTLKLLSAAITCGAAAHWQTSAFHNYLLPEQAIGPKLVHRLEKGSKAAERHYYKGKNDGWTWAVTSELHSTKRPWQVQAFWPARLAAASACRFEFLPCRVSWHSWGGCFKNTTVSFFHLLSHCDCCRRKGTISWWRWFLRRREEFYFVTECHFYGEALLEGKLFLLFRKLNNM